MTAAPPWDYCYRNEARQGGALSAGGELSVTEL
jgi:hypothetical protein